MNPFDIEVFYDGKCPLCSREIAWLQRRDKHGRIRFSDIAHPTFDVNSVGVSRDDLMARIHGRLPDGKMVTGVEVFRRLYSTIGFQPLVWLSRLPLVSQLLDLGYQWFAKNRLRFTGRCDESAGGQGCDVNTFVPHQEGWKR
jgi:predicted DCC family thiol-disulfide oxidoreductase YuxK